MSIQTELLSAPKVPLRYLARFNPRPTAIGSDESCYIPMEAISEFGAVDTSRMRPTVELAQGYSFVADGDVAYAKVTPCFENGKGLRAAGLPGGHAFATTEITVIRPSSQLDHRYLAWILQSEEFRAVGEAHMTGAGGLKRVPESYAARYRVPHPSTEVQRAIADYLDRETALIDAFIAKNEELITLLAERRGVAAQSKVEQHVGEGSRLKFQFREIDVRAGSRWEELPMLSVSIHHGVVPRDDNSESSSEASDLSHYKVASSGDIVLNRMRAFQGGLGVAPCTGLVSPDYAVLRPEPDVDPDWLALVMRTPRFVSEMILRLRGIGTTDSGAVRTPRISVADLGEIVVSVPATTVQATELRAVTTYTDRIEVALSIARRSVELARERRAALISAAVTGKIDVGVDA